MKNNKNIGIIGGAGPIAGSILFNQIIDICQKKYQCHQDADFPLITNLSFPFSDMFTLQSFEQREIIKNELKSCFSMLLNNNCNIIVIACNTLHEFLDHDFLNRNLKGNFFLNMIQETGFLLKKQRISNAFVLCSETSADCGLHKKYFSCNYPEKAFQKEIQDLICKILSGNFSYQDSEILSEKLNKKFLNNSEKIALVLGCTEFSVLNHTFPLRQYLSEYFSIVDTNQIIAEKICDLVFNP